MAFFEDQVWFSLAIVYRCCQPGSDSRVKALCWSFFLYIEVLMRLLVLVITMPSKGKTFPQNTIALARKAKL